MDSLSLFLSYNSVDRLSVVAVQKLLEARGITTFLDRDRLTRGFRGLLHLRKGFGMYAVWRSSSEGTSAYGKCARLDLGSTGRPKKKEKANHSRSFPYCSPVLTSRHLFFPSTPGSISVAVLMAWLRNCLLWAAK